MPVPKKRPMAAGPMRDLLGKLTAARRAGEWVAEDVLADRLGWSRQTVRRRLMTGVEAGHIMLREESGGAVSGQATEAGMKVIG